MTDQHPRLLLVEGADELRVIPEFIEQCGLEWPRKDADRWPAKLIDCEGHGGIKRLLAPGRITNLLKAPGRAAVGVVIDADDDPTGRWQGLRAQALAFFPNLPADLPLGQGVVDESPDGLRFGAWLMPDCGSPGMLETFLAGCLPDPGDPLWPFVVAHCHQAKTVHNAPFLDPHRDKARIHAWLALQNPPGQQLHAAFTQHLLRPGSSEATAFFNWFRKLFRV